VTYLIVEAVIYEITGLSARREFDRNTQVSLPVLGNRPDAGTDAPARAGEKKTPRPRREPEEKSELPGGLADIIRDLTRRPPV